MAPGATATASRGPSKLSKPTKVRYWKGKPLGVELDPEDSDDDESDEDGQESAVQKRKRLQAQQAAEREARIDKDVVAGGAGRVMRQAPLAVKVDLKGVEVGKAGPIAAVKKEEEESSEEETDDEEEEEEVKPKVSIPKPPGEEVSLTSRRRADGSLVSMRQIARKNRKKRRSLLSDLYSYGKIRGV